MNINDKATVKLTSYGVDVLRTEDPLMYDYNFNIETSILSAELWKIMKVFGPTMFMGSTEQAFESNEIEVSTWSRK